MKGWEGELTKTMLKILMLNYEFPPLGGGGGVAAKKIASAFVKQGDRIDCLTTGFRGLKSSEKIDGIMVYRVKVIGRKRMDTASLFSMITFPFFGFFKAYFLCSKRDYDLIHSHFAVPSGVLGVLIAKLFGKKHVLSIHGGDIYDPTKKFSPHKKWYLRRVVTWVINNSDKVIAQSSYTRQLAQKYYKIKKQIDVIPFPYSPCHFKIVSREELGLEPDKKYIISIGRLIKIKGYSFLFKALALMGDKDVECLIIGDGPQERDLVSLAKSLNVLHRIHFIGACFGEKKFQYLANADIYVLSSIRETFAIVLQEAMDIGLPIISTNIGGQMDFLGKKNAILIPPKDENALRVAIERLLRDRSFGEVLVRNNREKLKIFYPENVIFLYSKVFDSLINKDRDKFINTNTINKLKATR